MSATIKIDRTPGIAPRTQRLYITLSGYMLNLIPINRDIGVRLSLATTRREWDMLITEGGLWHV